MSKYTTEVRFICEEQAGLQQSKGAYDVDNILSQSWLKIFTTKATIFDESYRSVICKKILKHYYLREIGCEVYGIWKLWMNTRLEEILPYYNQLWASAELDFNPFDDVNLTTEQARVRGRSLVINSAEGESHLRASSNTGLNLSANVNADGATTTSNGVSATVNATDESQSETGSSTRTPNLSRTDRYSDTPQGALTGIQNNTYLTNARIVDDTGTEKSTTTGGSDTGHGAITGSKDSAASGTSAGSIAGSKGSTAADAGEITGTKRQRNDGHSDGSIDGLRNRVKGKSAGKSYAELLQEYRDTMLNIDMMVVNEFEDLFMQLW